MFFPKRQDEFARKSRAMKPDPETLRGRIKEVLSGADSLEEQQVRLKEFKDREIFLIDPDHILQPEVDFRVLSKRHTLLADRDLFPPPVESMEFTHPPMKNGGVQGDPAAP